MFKKSMTPTTLKDGSGFRIWRETFNRWIEVNQAGMKEVLKELAKGGEIKQEDIQRKCGKEAEGPGWIEELQKGIQNSSGGVHGGRL